MLKDGEKIILYHGSYCKVEFPNLDFCNDYKDFGKGFYLTTDRKQAERFAQVISRRKGTDTKFVNIYEFHVSTDLNIKEFTYPNYEWFKFVCSNRSKKCKHLNPLKEESQNKFNQKNNKNVNNDISNNKSPTLNLNLLPTVSIVLLSSNFFKILLTVLSAILVSSIIKMKKAY